MGSSLAQKNLTFLLVPDDSSRIKRFKLSGFWLRCAVCLVIIVFSGACYLFYDYFRMKASLPGIQLLQNQLQNQRSQFSAFSDEINILKQEIITLKRLDARVRVIADIDDPPDKQAMFGVGGSRADDLYASLPPTTSQNTLVREMHEELEHLKMASDLQLKSFQDLITSLEKKKSLLAATPSIKPAAGWISSGFGYRTSPFTGRREFHKGLDIAAHEGTEIIAPASGVVTFVGKKGVYGLLAVIDHGHGIVTRYAHLKEFSVKHGDKVKRGDRIGAIGNTGRSTGPHLHYEVTLKGIHVNPREYILDSSCGWQG